jgi:hypothetical protein
MFSKPMYREMLRHLRESGASPLLVARYNEHWRNAHQDPALPLPCPACYLQSRVSTLRAMPQAGTLASLRCEVCSASFEFQAA